MVMKVNKIHELSLQAYKEHFHRRPEIILSQGYYTEEVEQRTLSFNSNVYEGVAIQEKIKGRRS